MLKLVKPDKSMEKEYLDYIKEWKEEGEAIVPASSNNKDNTFDEWLLGVKNEEKKETCASGFVPANTYFLMNQTGRILGAINIRHELNDYLYQFGGHIGYGVRKTERGKGYATKMLKLALPIAKELDLEFVLITCSKENIASAQTIKKCGGVLENEVDENGEITQRYWIDTLKVDSTLKNPVNQSNNIFNTGSNTNLNINFTQEFDVDFDNDLDNSTQDNFNNKSKLNINFEDDTNNDSDNDSNEGNKFHQDNAIKLSWW